MSSVHMGNLIPVTEMKNVQKAPKIPVEPRSHLSATLQAMRSSYEHIEMFVKKRVARQDLGNKASPVDWAHINRPLPANVDRFCFPGLIYLMPLKMP